MKLLALGTTIGNVSTIGPLGNEVSTDTTSFTWLTQFVGLLSNIIGVLTLIGGLWFLFRIITSAVAWISAGGDKNAVEASKQKITQAVIGLLIVVTAYGLIGIVGAFVGIDLINLGDLIKVLRPPAP